MALVIEDGSGVTGANSYVTAQNYDDWATARGISHTHSDTQLEQFILRALKMNCSNWVSLCVCEIPRAVAQSS